MDQALGDDAVCHPYVTDKLVRVAPTKVLNPDVVVSCDIADHGESQIIDSPVLVVEVLSRSTEMTDRFVKLALYQAKESIQEIIFISQVIQRVEVFSCSTTDWIYHRLSIPAVVKEVEEEYISESELGNNE